MLENRRLLSPAPAVAAGRNFYGVLLDRPTTLAAPGLPFSLVFRAEPRREDIALRIASAYEAASRRHMPPPPSARFRRHGGGGHNPGQNANCVRITRASNSPPTGVPSGVPAMPPPAAVENRLLMSPCRKSNMNRTFVFGYQFNPTP
jgi:hypothetical protein